MTRMELKEIHRDKLDRFIEKRLNLWAVGCRNLKNEGGGRWEGIEMIE